MSLEELLAKMGVPVTAIRTEIVKLIQRFPDGAIPLGELLRTVNEHLTVDNIRTFAGLAGRELVEAVMTGRSEVKHSPVNLA